LWGDSSEETTGLSSITEQLVPSSILRRDEPGRLDTPALLWQRLHVRKAVSLHKEASGGGKQEERAVAQEGKVQSHPTYPSLRVAS
jgi:hypothetical protein